MSSWKNVRLCLQQIYLSDDTIAANIAFGIDLEKIDMYAAKRRRLRGFMISLDWSWKMVIQRLLANVAYASLVDNKDQIARPYIKNLQF